MLVKENNKINGNSIIRYTSDSNKYVRFKGSEELYQEIVLFDDFDRKVIETSIEIESEQE